MKSQLGSNTYPSLKKFNPCPNWFNSLVPLLSSTESGMRLVSFPDQYGAMFITRFVFHHQYLDFRPTLNGCGWKCFALCNDRGNNRRTNRKERFLALSTAGIVLLFCLQPGYSDTLCYVFCHTFLATFADRQGLLLLFAIACHH